MDTSRRGEWIRAVLVAGIAYIVIGRSFTLPTDHMQAWRLGAWAICGIIYAVHICYEHFILRHPPRALAVHVAIGVAIGGFGLAVAGMIHSLSSAPGIRPAWILALVLFPAFTAVPAFVGALVAATLLRRLRPSPDTP